MRECSEKSGTSVLFERIRHYKDVIEKFHVFDYFKKWKEEGKIKHIGFSFHDTADILDQILTDHPETDFVQIVWNYYDTDSPFVQAQQCYDVIRKHGKEVVIMEPVKDGMLAHVPEKAAEEMKKLNPDLSPASYALRAAAEKDGVIAALSGMSNMEQMDDNTSFMKDFRPLDEKEKKVIAEAKQELIAKWPLLADDIEELHSFNINGINAGDIVEAYNSIMIQPNFGCELNYISCLLYLHGHDKKTPTDTATVILADGRDVTADVLKAYDYLVKYSL